MDTSRVVQTLPSLESPAWSPDGSHLATIDFDKLIVYETDGWTELFRVDADITGAVATQFAAWSPDSRTIATASKEVVLVWDSTTGELLDTLGGHTGEIYSVQFSPDGRCLASSSSDETVILWELAPPQS